MARCNDCNKFVSFDEPEVEVQLEEIDGTSLLVEVRMARPCAECGTELAEYTFAVEQDVECPNCGIDYCGGHYSRYVDKLLPLPDGKLPSDKLDEEDALYDEVVPELVLSNTEPEATERDDYNGALKADGTYRRLKYPKSYIGVHVAVEIECGCCGESFEVAADDETTPGSFEEMN